MMTAPMHVTHDADVARYASRVITLRDGQILSDTRQTPERAAERPAAVKVA